MKRKKAWPADRVRAQVYSTKEAAGYLGLSVDGFRYHIKQGNLVPDKKYGSVNLFMRGTLNNFNRRPPGGSPKEQILDRWATEVEMLILFTDRADRKWVRGHTGRADGITHTYLLEIGKPNRLTWERFHDLAYEVGAILEDRGVLVEDEDSDRPDWRHISVEWIKKNKPRIRGKR